MLFKRSYVCDYKNEKCWLQLVIRAVLTNICVQFTESEAVGHETEELYLFKNGLIPSQVNA